MRRYQLQAERTAAKIQSRTFPDAVTIIKADLEGAYEDGFRAGVQHVYQMSRKADDELEEIRRMNHLATASSE